MRKLERDTRNERSGLLDTRKRYTGRHVEVTGKRESRKLRGTGGSDKQG